MIEYELIWNATPIVSFFVFGAYYIIREVYLHKKGIRTDSWGKIIENG